uniref:Uncharacterized protein n=1 Tax=Odontella aurita TaxID=265563 RepID=A0A7S4K9Z7_9STRA|mmetsp:Transcript_7753/g.22796  ORF Transcript_7753/g.22796 Transcript_7753/m.22796 type:complete len:648 (+) Transcript_7753:378-2321(+)
MSESEPLVGRGGIIDGGASASSTSASSFAASISRWCNRLLLLTLIVALLSVSLLFNFRMRSVAAHLAEEDEAVTKLSMTVQDQAAIIERFADSVTNSDVLTRVDSLKDELDATSRTMSDRLEATEDRIGNLLNATLITLDTIVSEAQNDIHVEVDRVKTDVDEYVRTTQDQFSMENSFMVYQLAGTFTLLACLISMWHMTAHLRTFREPFVQRKILAILWMSPLYGITSWLSLVYPFLEGYLAVVKDFYEAYVIYQFLSFCIAVLGRGDRNAVVALLTKHADHLEPPFHPLGVCFPKEYESDRDMAEEVLLQCQAFAMQFVFFRPLTTIGTFACNEVGYFGMGESATDYRSPQFWFLMIQNVSVFVAFSGLLKFYHAVQDDLSWCRPFPKFLCIKGIVFMTFWQGLVIAILAKTTEQQPAPGVAQAQQEAGVDPDIWAKQAQNFLICLEMLLFSIAHFYCFPTEEWAPGYRPKDGDDTKFGDNIALRDFFSDLKLIVKGGSGKSKRRKSKKAQKKKADLEQGGGGDEDEGKGKGEGEGRDVGEEEDDDGDLDRSVYTEATTTLDDGGSVEEPMTPQMKMAAARLMASLNFNGNGSDQIDEETAGGMAGLMEKITMMNDSDDEDDGTGGVEGRGGGRGGGGNTCRPTR